MKGPISILIRYKNKGGFSLLEILVVVGLMAVITVGTVQLATVSIQSSQVVRGTFSEQELRIAVNNILTNDNHCKANLKPETGRLTGSDSQKGIGTISKLEQDGVALLEEGKSFKGNLDIVKLELAGNASEDPKLSTVNRKFVVYYSKKLTKDLNTLEGGTCTSSDTSGCYFLECDLDYRLENVGVTPDVLTCDTLNCVGGDDISCYTADLEEPSLTGTINVQLPSSSKVGKGRTLMGCGGTSDTQVSTMTAFGFESGINTVTGLVPNQDGSFNTFMGYQSGYNNTTGVRNNFFGFQSGYSNTTGIRNIFIGDRAGYSNTLGSDNTFSGYRAGYANTLGSSNIFLGSHAGFSNTTGKSNVFIGAAVGHSNTTGEGNIYIGRQAGFSATTARNNIFIGYKAGQYNILGHSNIFMGTEAGSQSTTSNNIAIGHYAGEKLLIASEGNIFIGNEAGKLTTGKSNTFIGHRAGAYKTVHSQNTYIGRYAGVFNTRFGNTIVGAHSGIFDGLGQENVFIGMAAGMCLPTTIPAFTHPWTGSTGEAERKTWSVNCTGSKNVFIGKYSGRQNVSGDLNTFVGHESGLRNTTGEKNTFIGQGAGRSNTTGNQNLYIGYNILGGPGFSSATGASQLNIGNLILGRLNTSAPTGPSIPSSPGVVIHGTLESAKRLTVHTGGLSVSGGFTCTGAGCPGTPSSRVYKKNIKKFKNFERAYEDIKKTPLFTYEYKEDHPNKSRMGFISEELPKYLQIKDKGSPSMPDMPSIYGTFWGAIKALIIKFEEFKENTLSALKKVTEEVTAIKENTLSALKTLTKKVTVIINEIEEIKKTWAKEKEELKGMIVQQIQSVDLKVQSQKKVSEENATKLSHLSKVSVENATQLSHVGEKIGGAMKTSENNQEEINKLNTLIRLQQKTLISQQKKITQLETKFENIEEKQKKAEEQSKDKNKGSR